MTKLKTLEGDEAVQFENFMYSGNLDVNNKLHDDIEPRVEEGNFIVQIWEYERGLLYEYGDKSTNLHNEGNWSEMVHIVGINDLEKLEKTMSEVSFI